jgi:DNA-binding NarL/FixJ family response regulator
LYICDDYSEQIANTAHGPYELNKRLSSRQNEVLDLMLWGFTNTEIAELLYVSIPTVKAHIKVIPDRRHLPLIQQTVFR